MEKTETYTFLKSVTMTQSKDEKSIENKTIIKYLNF